MKKMRDSVIQSFNERFMKVKRSWLPPAKFQHLWTSWGIQGPKFQKPWSGIQVRPQNPPVGAQSTGDRRECRWKVAWTNGHGARPSRGSHHLTCSPVPGTESKHLPICPQRSPSHWGSQDVNPGFQASSLCSFHCSTWPQKVGVYL